jgi:hypothetical protein
VGFRESANLGFGAWALVAGDAPGAQFRQILHRSQRTICAALRPPPGGPGKAKPRSSLALASDLTWSRTDTSEAGCADDRHVRTPGRRAGGWPRARPTVRQSAPAAASAQLAERRPRRAARAVDRRGRRAAGASPAPHGPAHHPPPCSTRDRRRRRGAALARRGGRAAGAVLRRDRRVRLVAHQHGRDAAHPLQLDGGVLAGLVGAPGPAARWSSRATRACAPHLRPGGATTPC